MKATPRILLFTGNGKGKTTAALGMVLRASGHGLRSLVVEFIKQDGTTGEIAACGHLPGVEIVQTGMGFVPDADAPGFPAHREAAQSGLTLARRAVEGRQYDVIVLDEVCTAVKKGLLEESAVLDCLHLAAPETCLVMTGRGATDGLIAAADTATDMTMIRHGLTCGRKAQKGVEY